MNNPIPEPHQGRGGRVVAGIFPDYSAALIVVRHLTDAGFTPENINVLGSEEIRVAATRGRLGLPDTVEQTERRRDIAWGALSGVFLGLLFGAEVAAFAGLAGLATLSTLAGSMVTGAATGAIYGDGQADLDISEEATALREAIHTGQVMVLVALPTPVCPSQAQQIMNSSGAEWVRDYTFTSPEMAWSITEIEATARDLVDVGLWEVAEEEKHLGMESDQEVLTRRGKDGQK